MIARRAPACNSADPDMPARSGTALVSAGRIVPG